MGALLLLLGACQKPDNPTPAPAPTPTPAPVPTPTPTPTQQQEIVVPTNSQSIFSNGISFNSGEEPSSPGSGGGSDSGSGDGGGGSQGGGSAEPQTQTVNFTAPAAWTATVAETKAVDWLKVEPSSGSAGDVTMTVTAQPNDTYDDRSATVTIKSGNTSATFTVKQAGKPRPSDPGSGGGGDSDSGSGGDSGSGSNPGGDSGSSSGSSGDSGSSGNGDSGAGSGAGDESGSGSEAGAGQSGDSEEPPTAIPVTSVTISPSSLTLTEGETASLTATVSPENATYSGVVWYSDAPTVVAVYADGRVEALLAVSGTVTINAMVGGVKGTCKVTVRKKAIPVESISLDKTALELEVGENTTLTATVNPDNATNKTVTWSSSDTAVAKVTQNGIVTAIKTGTATISAKAGDQIATCIVKVPVPAGGNEGIGYDE